jgi:16S rRNA G1207 methylase RsmC
VQNLISRLRAKWARGEGRDRLIRSWPKGKEEFHHELARRLEDLDRETELLRMAASRRVSPAEVEFLDRLSDLQKRIGRMSLAVQVYRSEEGKAWQSFRSMAVIRWTELKRQLTDASNWYRARHPRGPKTAPAAEPGVELLQTSPAAESEIGPS